MERMVHHTKPVKRHTGGARRSAMPNYDD